MRQYSDDALMKASHEVTEALQRTIGLMQGELERSVLSSQMLGKLLMRALMMLCMKFIAHRRIHCIPALDFLYSRHTQ